MAKCHNSGNERHVETGQRPKEPARGVQQNGERIVAIVINEFLWSFSTWTDFSTWCLSHDVTHERLWPAVSTVPAPVLKFEYRCKSDMGPPAIWGPPYPHITSSKFEYGISPMGNLGTIRLIMSS